MSVAGTMFRHKANSFLFLFGLCFVCSCSQKTTAPQQENVVATVGGEPITRQQLERELLHRSPALPSKSADEQKRVVLDELVQFKALLVEAKKAGYDRDPELLDAYHRMIVGKYEQDRLQPKAPKPPSDEEIAAFYNASVSKYSTPEMIRASLIFLQASTKATEEKRAEVRKKAEDILAELKQKADTEGAFELAAQKHSEDQATRYRGGDIGWLRRNASESRWLPKVLDAVFALHNVGELSPVVEVPTGFYIVKLTSTKPAAVRPLSEVKAELQRQMIAQNMEKVRENLREQAKKAAGVQINERVLEGIEIPKDRGPDASPPSMPER